jgi:hypothetical protein
MTVNGLYLIFKEEEGMNYLKILSWNSTGKSGQKHDENQPEYLVVLERFVGGK